MGKKIARIIGRVLLVVLVTIVMLVGTLFIMIKRICSDSAPAARNLFISTVLESGQMKFLASWFCTDAQINEVINANKMESMDSDIDTSLINISSDTDTQTVDNNGEVEQFDGNGIRMVEISGRSFFGKMLIIKDPSQVKITYNSPSALSGLYLIGLNKDNLLVVKDIDGMSAADFESYVNEAGIRDAVAFQEESSDSNNHFVPLIINNEARVLKGQGSGANPRTAIGQRADGAILLLVTDGRGASGHLGATASDLISVMQEYGAVNAANLDGGSSSTMVYNGGYEMTSVNNTKKSINIGKINIPLNYWTGLAVYAVILLILAICMIAYTGSCLKKYENSQSDKVMNDFINDFTKMAADKTLADNIELPASSEFEGKDTFVNMYMSELDGTTDYTYKKSEGSYNTEEPMYDIYADDKKVARMTLEAKDQHVVLGILTVFDWKVKSIEPVFSAKTNDYTVSIPEGYTFTVNGITVSDDYKTGKVIENPDFVNVSKYVTMPKSVEYKLTGFVNKPEIKIYNASGSEVTANVDAKGNVSVAASGNSADMPSERKEEALNMAKIWDNFLTNDLSGSGHGLATVQQYLIEDSYYWNLAKDYASSADITFISDHTLSGNPYTGVTVDNYIEYNDDCYSCHIAFTKNMTLTSGGARKDVIDSTFYFVKYEGRWAIADMIATTK